MDRRLKAFLETKDEELITEIKALKQSLKCKSYSQDWDFLTSDLDRKIFNQKGWPSPAVITDYLITQTYYEKDALEPLAFIYKDHSWPVSGFIHDFVSMAEKSGRYDLIEQVWKGVLEVSKRRFFEWLPDREKYSEDGEVARRADEIKQNAVFAFENLEKFYQSQNNQKAREEIAKARDTFEREEFKKDLPPPSHQKFTEEVFWQLLKEAFLKTPSVEEGRVQLMHQLEKMSGAFIGKVYSFYAKKMQDLYHWNVWALAYGACGGCSDDSFLDFRGWLIMRGDPDLLEIAIKNPEKAAPQIPFEPEVLEGGLLSAIEGAYLARMGKLPKAVSLDLEKPKGREWDEEDFDKTFPALAAIYNLK